GLGRTAAALARSGGPDEGEAAWPDTRRCGDRDAAGVRRDRGRATCGRPRGRRGDRGGQGAVPRPGAAGAAMSVVHVFAGETLQRDAAAGLVPQALLHPPTRRGDLLGVAGPGDVVVIIDGDPHHPPRHDEILSLLASGVAVAGAGGLGAVLAADMHPYGMTGIGNIFAGLQDGSITDDEASCQWPGGRGDLRTLLTLAAVRGAITRSDARRIAEQARVGSDRWTWADLCRAADLSLESPLRQFHAW